MDTTHGALTWRKSSYSGGEGTECVEVARSGDLRWFRDSKSPGVCPSPVSAVAWGSFLASVTGVISP